jgi:hypothetical protein
MDYKSKYLKYKQKYLELKKYKNAISGGCLPDIDLPYIDDYINLISRSYIFGSYLTKIQRSQSKKASRTDSQIASEQEKKSIENNNFINCATKFVSDNLDMINNFIYIQTIAEASKYSETNIIFVDGMNLLKIKWFILSIYGYLPDDFKLMVKNYLETPNFYNSIDILEKVFPYYFNSEYFVKRKAKSYNNIYFISYQSRNNICRLANGYNNVLLAGVGCYAQKDERDVECHVAYGKNESDDHVLLYTYLHYKKVIEYYIKSLKSKRQLKSGPQINLYLLTCDSYSWLYNSSDFYPRIKITISYSDSGTNFGYWEPSDVFLKPDELVKLILNDEIINFLSSDDVIKFINFMDLRTFSGELFTYQQINGPIVLGERVPGHRILYERPSRIRIPILSIESSENTPLSINTKKTGNDETELNGVQSILGVANR